MMSRHNGLPRGSLRSTSSLDPRGFRKVWIRLIGSTWPPSCRAAMGSGKGRSRSASTRRARADNADRSAGRWPAHLVDRRSRPRRLARGNDYVGRGWVFISRKRRPRAIGRCRPFIGDLPLSIWRTYCSSAAYACLMCFIAAFVALPLVTATLFCDVRAASASSSRAAGLSVMTGSHGSIVHSFESEPGYDKASTRSARLAA